MHNFYLLSIFPKGWGEKNTTMDQRLWTLIQKSSEKYQQTEFSNMVKELYSSSLCNTAIQIKIKE